MQEITVYQGMTHIQLPQPDGTLVTTELPEPAHADAAFLASWLFGKSEKTQIAYLADMHKFYAHTGLSLQAVKLADVQEFIQSLYNLKVSSQARAIATIKSALSFGLKTGYLTFNVGAPDCERSSWARRYQRERITALDETCERHALYRGRSDAFNGTGQSRA